MALTTNATATRGR